MQKTGAQLTEADILGLGKQFEVRIPDDYKAFMLENNGGIPEEDWAFDFIVYGGEDPTSSVINYFHTIYPQEEGGYDSLRRAFSISRDEGYSPAWLIPIGSDPGGNIVFLDGSEEGNGKVLFGDHELEDPETGYIIMSPIADSFTEFLDKLYIPTYE